MRYFLRFLAFILVAGCSCDSEPNGSLDAAFEDAAYDSSVVDSVMMNVDANVDAGLDASLRVDATVDASLDSRMEIDAFVIVDASVDTAFDAALDSAFDSALDSAIDARTSVCGDGVLDADERCDDGNLVEEDGCAADCLTQHSVCGDGQKEAFERCDDGVTSSCFSTHDGGDGICRSFGICSAGYMLDARGQCVAEIVSGPGGITDRCASGDGWSLFRIRYTNNASSPRVETWNASCDYSFAPNSACNVRDVCRGFCDVPRARDNSPIINTGQHYLRIRFSVDGLHFSNARLHVKAAGFATLDAWSPIYGSTQVGPFRSFGAYEWQSSDWSSFLMPGDEHGLTAVQLKTRGSTATINAVEICID